MVDETNKSDKVEDLKTVPRSGLRLVTLGELHGMGRSTAEVVGELLAIDYSTLSGLSHKNAGSTGQWVPVIEKSPDGLCVVLDGTDRDRIIGYWHYVGLEPGLFKVAKAGRLFEKDITAAGVMDISSSHPGKGAVPIYFVSISVMPAYRGVRVSRLLYAAFMGSLKALSDRGIVVSELGAVAFSEAGRMICRSFGMIRLCGHVDRGDVYWKGGLSL